MELKILVAERFEMLMRSLSEQLANRFSVETCKDGRHVLERLRRFEPDILVLDLEMPGLDGMSVLRAIRSSGRKVDILVTTACFYSDYVIQTLVQLGVQYILPRPCTVAAVTSRVCEMALMHEGRERGVNDEVDALLLSLGMRMSLGGYACLSEAVVLMAQDQKQQVTKVLYPEIATKCGGNAKRVERAIRSVIKDAWKRRDDSIWSMYFSTKQEGLEKCPTNGYLISRLAMCLEERKTG